MSDVDRNIAKHPCHGGNTSTQEEPSLPINPIRGVQSADDEDGDESAPLMPASSPVDAGAIELNGVDVIDADPSTNQP